ncbi:pseudouridylate synthase [Parvibium lacunae]|uniref:tRNA pseudouridine synthase C n=2 Tax=Parvibium lacunae TaxID=1888893 RepID=A0A368L5G9_9BURK|nr:pseudouridylate synthase [Parvibium lacunae]
MVDKHETQFAVQMLRDQICQHVYPVHRLDRGTSGVLLFALNREVASLLGKQFEAQTVEKTYLAIVRGHPPERGTIDYPLSRQPDAAEYLPSGMQRELAPQPAVTHYQRLATVTLPVMVERYPTSRYALMRLHPETGRRHQLRRHMKHIAHPIIGDATHGKGIHNRYFKQTYDCGRLLLACVKIAFIHPLTAQPCQVRAPLSNDFASLLPKLGWQAIDY